MKIIVITGQTATGKTKFALDLARQCNGQLINCDSRQIYKYLDIVTGKDIVNKSKVKNQKSKFGYDIGYYLTSGRTSAVEERSGKTAEVKIWLYDIIDPKQYFSSFDFQQCALYVIKKLIAQRKTPIIVGGTYLYLKHLLYHIETEKIPPDWPLRKQLADKSVKELQKILKAIDRQSFKRLNQSDQNNPQRLIRKIEITSIVTVKHLTNTDYKKISLQKKLGYNNLQVEFIGLKYKQKEDLILAIKRRVKKRIQQGAFKEVVDLLSKGYKQSDPGLKTIGYQQIIQYLKGRLVKEETINQWITKEVQYAKRQLTFMKKDKNIKWRIVF